MRVFTYSRYSTDRQTETSIIDQQRRCHEYAASRSWSISADFTDQGISGAAFGNRPGARAALEELAAGDVLLIMDLSRLSRSQELAPLMDRLRYRGARVIGILDGFDSDSPQARMQAGLSGIMSDELRSMIRMRTHSALELRAKHGRATGGKTYGFARDGAVVEQQAAVVREIFERFSGGESMKAIASDLNVRGVPSAGASWSRELRRRDGRWLVSALHALLHNERYMGRVVWNRSQWIKNPDTGRRERRERPESDWIVTEGPQLIDRRSWDRAAVRLRERALVMQGGYGRRKYLLSGILVCQSCDSSLVVTGKDGRQYVCGTHKMGGNAACSVRECADRVAAEQIVLRPVLDEMLGTEGIDYAVEMIEAREREARELQLLDQSPELVAIAAELADIEALVQERPARAAALSPAIGALEDRRLALHRLAWRRVVSVPPGRSQAVNDYIQAAREMREILTGNNVEAARAALRSVTGTVPVWPLGGHLMARVGLSLVPLVSAAGIPLRGSGGALWSQEARVFQLPRVA